MALQPCEDCGFPFSERASACPKCAGPRNPIVLQNARPPEAQHPPREVTKQPDPSHSPHESQSSFADTGTSHQMEQGPAGSGGVSQTRVDRHADFPEAATMSGGQDREGQGASIRQHPSRVGAKENVHQPPEGQPAATDAPTAIAEEETPRHPWRRYWAKMTDVILFSIVFIFVGAAFFPGLFETEGMDFLLGILVLAAFAVWDSVILWAFETSPGRKLMKAELFSTDQTPLTLERLLARNGRVYLNGLGVGFPLVSLFTLANGHKKVSQGKLTSWDRSARTNYRYGELEAWSWILLILFFGAWFAITTWAAGL